METKRICPGCGKALATNAPMGLCPECLIQGGFPTGTETPTGAHARFVPPTMQELAAVFPQLDILELIGTGGMGAVYRARQKQLNRVVALKILPPGVGTDPAFAERFTREAQALAQLNHPGIVTLYEFGVAAGTAVQPGFQPGGKGMVAGEVGPGSEAPSSTSAGAPNATSLYYFLMEFVDGVNLRHLLNAGRVSAREALAIVPQICDALQYAHDQGIVHRDIKPENILLDRRGRVKVADFGLAKIISNDAPLTPSSASDGERVAQPGERAPVLTHAGKIMGTPQYMSPEQIEAPGEVDHRADIYALGVVFYQMLTGELPGKPLVPPSRAGGKVQIDVRLDEVVLRALENKPELRYQQASILKTQVETIVSTPAEPGSLPPAAPPERPKPARSSSAMTVVSIVTAGMLAFAGWAAHALGIFFNALFVFILLMVPALAGLLVWRLFRKTLEVGLFRRPFARNLRGHLFQTVNLWVFCLLTLMTLEACIVPTQFTSEEYSVIRLLYRGGIAVIMVLALFPGKRIHVATNAVFAAGSIFMGWQMTRIYRPVPNTTGVVLSAPFRGEWAVFHGGRSSLINSHYDYSNQSDALDLVRLINGQDRTGSAQNLESYPAWGETLYAPVDGKIATVVSNRTDCQIGQMDDRNPGGNHVCIDMGDSRYVVMAHLQQGSILVSPGDVVHAGQPIARCGNSGNTSQPHLHLQVQDNPEPFSVSAKTFPISFDRVTVIRRGRTIADPALFVRRNDRLIAESSGANAAFQLSNTAVGVIPGDVIEDDPGVVAARAGEHKITWTNGVSFEIIGILRNPRQSKAWFRPDGTPFEKPPAKVVRLYDQQPAESPAPTVLSGNEVLVFFRFQSPDGVYVVRSGQKWQPNPLHLSGSNFPTVRDLSTGNESQWVSHFALRESQSALPALDLEVQIVASDAEWEPVAVYDGATTKEFGVMAVFSPPHYDEQGKRYVIDAMHNIPRDKHALRLVARLKDGGRKVVDFHSGVQRGTPTKGFALIYDRELDIRNVEEYVLERTPLLRGQIRNIALQPHAASAVDTTPTAAMFRPERPVKLPDAGVRAEALGFKLQPQIELVLPGVQGNLSHWLDLDTGRQMSLSLAGSVWDSRSLLRTNGLDIMGITTDQEVGVSCPELVVRQIDGSLWDNATVDDIIAGTESAPANVGTGAMMAIATSPRKPITMFFRTREGGRGILQIMGKSDNPLGVNIRYRLVQAQSLPDFGPGARGDAPGLRRPGRGAGF